MLSEIEWLRCELAKERERSQRKSAAIGYFEGHSGCKLGDIDDWYEEWNARWKRKLYMRLVREATPTPEPFGPNESTAQQRAIDLIVC